MCGIVGAYGASSQENWIKSELKRLIYRGPDSQSFCSVSPNLIMGATRLAMTDPLPRSNQPMIDVETGDVLTFNGEIYNFREIRNSLLGGGQEFVTNSDTEVLLKLLIKNGITSLGVLNGMFAFAYFSSIENRVYLSRDLLGKKPLYYYVDPGRIKWSSSIESLKLNLNNQPISNSALLEYLSLGYLIDPNTTSSEIFSVMPGEVISIDLNTGAVNKSFFNQKFRIAQHRLTNVRKVISESVQARIEGQNSVAISLSGGVDSTIVALEAIESGAKTSAYSAFWPNPDKSRYNTDSNTARNIAEKLGIHFELVQMIDVSEVEKELVRFVHAMHEPNNNPTGVSMMRLYEKISTDGHRLVLTGDGADEIFAGYKRYNIIRKIPNLFRINPDFLGNSLFLDSLNDGKITRKLAQSQANPDHINSWLSWHTVFSPIELLRLLADPASKGLAYNEIQNKLTGLSRSTNLRDKVEIMMHRDSLIWLTMESNRKLDRISMHYSIEARSPFQDDFVRSSAAKIMQDSGYKQLNKSFLWKDYPELKVLGVRKDKAGFISPLGHWLRGNRKIIENSFEILSQDRRFSIPELIRLKDAPWNRNYREISQLWTLIVLAYWMQENE